MQRFFAKNKGIVAALIWVILSAGTLQAESGPIDQLFEALKSAPAIDAEAIQGKLDAELSKSGSAALDLLLRKGQDAMDAGDHAAAAGHFRALTDQAPDFAEGWNGLATAYYFLGKHGPAFDAIEHALRAEPRHYRAIFGLVVMLEEFGDLDGALEAAGLIRAIHPHLPGLSEAVNRLEKLTEGQTL